MFCKKMISGLRKKVKFRLKGGVAKENDLLFGNNMERIEVKKKFLLLSIIIIFLTILVGCIELSEEDAGKYTYMNSTIDYEYFYNRDEDVSTIAMSDISAALVASVLSGVFGDNYIDVSTLKIVDISPGYYLYSGNHKNNPPAQVALMLEISAISENDYNNEKYYSYTLSKAITLSITYGQYAGVDFNIGKYDDLDLSDYDDDFNGVKKDVDDYISDGLFNEFATAEQLDKNKITEQFYQIYNDYQLLHH